MKFLLTPVYDVLLRGTEAVPYGLYHLQLAYAEQLCRLHYQPTSLKYVKKRMKELADHGYVQADNLFRASQTEQKLRREPIQGKTQANQTHYDVGKAVREFIVGQGNPPPEQLPTPDASIQELQRREQKRIEAERQPLLFPDDDQS